MQNCVAKMPGLLATVSVRVTLSPGLAVSELIVMVGLSVAKETPVRQQISIIAAMIPDKIRFTA